jgi:multidrug efflux pump
MSFTELFIRRPVLAIVLSVAILVVGLRAALSLPIQQFPQTESAVISVTTVYYGADSSTVAGFVTTPLEEAIAQVQGIDYMTSSSVSGLSTITAYLQLNYDARTAASAVSTQIDKVINQLPSGALRPAISISNSTTVDALYIGFHSDLLKPNEITDYIVREVKPQLDSIPGIQTAELLGAKNFAMRAWLDPARMAALGVTASDVAAALQANNAISGVGSTRGQMVQVPLAAGTGLHSLDGFRNLVIRQSNGAIVRLGDVATVSLGADDYDQQVLFNGKPSVYIGIQLTPKANLLDVISKVKAAFPQIQQALPKGLSASIIYDASSFVRDSLIDVVSALLEALLIVAAVVFVFIGSPRAVLVPILAIPISLVGTFTILLAFHFSINLLTLLALVLAIGLVVDDVIIMVENVNRHLEEGRTPVEAAVIAARELAGPIVAMTLVLIAVYVPIGFQGGLTGALFTEFAFTLAGAVTLSGVVALTLSPMMCSRMLRLQPAGTESRVARIFGNFFERLRQRYERRLDRSLNYRPVTYVFALIVLGSIYFLYTGAIKELAPQEDQGLVVTDSISAPTATLQQRTLYSQQLYKIAETFPELTQMFEIDVPGSSVGGLVLKPWSERSRSATEIQQLLQKEANGIAGARVVAFQPPSLPGATGLPVQFAITSTGSFDALNEAAQQILEKAEKSGLFAYVDSDLKIDLPQYTVNINRNKAALLGLTMTDIGNSLTWMLSGAYVNYFSLDGRAYKVIPQAAEVFRQNPKALLDYYIRTASGQSVPLSTIATITETTVPESLNHFAQRNAATIEGVPTPGVSLGAALDFLRGAAKDLPPGYQIDYGGSSRQFVTESQSMVAIFGFALIVVFLALAAQFESFRDPFIILVSVPMSIAGALVFINIGLGGVSLNIYTEVGLVTLMGLISKHGILIVEFANTLRKRGMNRREAVVQAASIRLRPVLMTTAAMVLGVVPLLMASGAGAASRFNMGVVIATGLSIGTMFTLYVLPAVYMLIAEPDAAPEAAAAAQPAE